jgi:outer membrane protein OmpA-like peptidoglycan-associated protein
MWNRTLRAVIGCLSLPGFLASGSACTTDPYTGQPTLSNAAVGGLLGAGVGAAIGAATGDNGKQRKKRALIGAGVGTFAGGGVGAYMDAQEAKLREQLRATGVGVQRVGQEIVLVMPGNITFNTDSADLQPDFFPVLNSVGRVLVEYRKTVVEIAGHTDATGSNDYNRRLSGERAETVSRYLKAQGVADMRLLALAFGEDRPVATNATAAGRTENRRVEITLAPVTTG